MTEETIGQRIRRLRLERKLSQRELAGPGVSYAYVSRIEAGHRTPSVKALRVIAGKLGVTSDYLETGEQVPAAKARELRLADAELELRLGRDLDRAEGLFRELLEQEAQDSVAARARAALGSLAARRGDNAEAIRQLEAVIAAGQAAPERRPDVYETLSTAYLATGAVSEAIELLEGSIAAVDAHAEYATQQVRFRTFLGTALCSIGVLDRARDVLAEATERARNLTFPNARVALYWTRGNVEWMDGDADTALAYIGRAAALAEATDDTLQVARAHLLQAQIYDLEQQPEEAGPHLEQAERLLEFGDDRADRGALRAEQARHAAQLGQAEQALAWAHESVEFLADDVRFAPNAWHALAAAHAAAGDIDAADREYRRAIDGLSEREQWREAVQVARDWARALRVAGREGDAYDVLERAMALRAREVGANHG